MLELKESNKKWAKINVKMSQKIIYTKILGRQLAQFDTYSDATVNEKRKVVWLN